MKPHALTPASLLVGIYVQDRHAVALGTLRTAGDALRTECVHHVGEVWQTLYNALGEVDDIGAQNVVILTNCGELVQALSRPFPAPDGDATLLAHAFVRRFGAQTGRDKLTLREDALEAVAAHQWPGKIRELE